MMPRRLTCLLILSALAIAALPAATADEWVQLFNGKDLTGNQLPNGGTYSLKVTALDSGGNALSTTTYQQGVVTGVTQNNGATSLTINGTPVNWANIVSINQVAAASTSSGTGTNGS